MKTTDVPHQELSSFIIGRFLLAVILTLMLFPVFLHHKVMRGLWEFFSHVLSVYGGLSVRVPVVDQRHVLRVYPDASSSFPSCMFLFTAARRCSSQHLKRMKQVELPSFLPHVKRLPTGLTGDLTQRFDPFSLSGCAATTPV